MTIEILQGDCLTILRTLPSNSIHCCITSPPYWGLRDYQTGVWVGGDPTCDHRSPTMREGRNETRQKLAGSAATNAYQNILAHNAHCGRCGATKKDAQMGLEPSVGEHLASLVAVFAEVLRVLRPDGTLWLNYGDAYAGVPNGRSAAATKVAGNDDRTFRDKPMSTVGGLFKAKDRMLLPARVAIALQESGWWLRDEIVWHKPNPMPISVKDRTTPAHEMLYMLSKSARYYYDQDAIKEPIAEASRKRYAQEALNTQTGGFKQEACESGLVGQRSRSRRPAEIIKTLAGSETRNRRSVWSIPTKSFPDAHFATFPPDLIAPCVLAGCPVGGTVLDPFFGAGTTGLVANRAGRNCIGIELNGTYVDIARKRLGLPCGVFA